MKQSPGLYAVIRYTGLLAIIIVGLVSIIGTGGSGGSSSPDQDRTYYRDADGDGYGNPNDFAEFDSRPLGSYVTDNTDCDDTDAAINPGATELCDDGIDNNCDGQIDVGCVCTDDDGDGYYAQKGCGTAVDCNDADVEIHPGVVEICWDDIDNNCDGQTDEGCTCTDADGDGYYAESDCGTAVDCNDADAAINPGAVEICGDGVDNNCDGLDQGCGTGDSLVPDTGQTTCYNNIGNTTTCPTQGRAFYGQDASYTINLPSYTRLIVNGAVMIRDNVTGLIWEAKTDDGGINDKDNRYAWYNAATALVDQLNADQFGGYSDWRLPTTRELLSIVNFGTYGPAVDTGYFPNTASSFYWSSGAYSGNPEGSCGVDFTFGYDYIPDRSGLYPVRAVRGERLPSSFTDNGDGTVTDNVTGLMWARDTAETTMTWQAALAWCENSSSAGYTDWRLPTPKELKSIVADDGDQSVIDAYFPDMVLSYYWSSTTNAYYPEDAWLVNFRNGNNSYGSKLSAYYVRAVRAGRK